MRLRYLVAAGPSEALDCLTGQLLDRNELALDPILRLPFLAAWAVPGTPCVRARDGSAAAIGLVFARADGRRQEHLPNPVPAERVFVERFWGAYVLLANPDGGDHRILRDPSGGVTAYHRRSGAIDLYASDAELLTAAASEPLEPDLEFVRQWLTFPLLRGRRTGARGVREILPGTSWQMRCAREGPSPVWSPWDHTRRSQLIDEPEAAACLLRQEILRTVPHLTAGAGDPVLQLSGGLDSSIVAAALAETGTGFRAVTFATRAPDGDERGYARIVARHCGAELTELVEEPAVPDLAEHRPIALRPAPNALLQPVHRAIETHLVLTGADLTLDGAGGDNVFCYLNTASPALDVLRRHGPSAGIAALNDVARLHGTTAWAVARAALRRARRRSVSWQPDKSFLAPGAAARHPPEHPWLKPARPVDRGTFEHVQMVVGIHHFLADPAPGRITAMHPLLAQPIVETCLRFPSWLWVRGGRDRAIARNAFRGLLPDSIIARRSKGQLGSLCTTGYMASRRQIEHMLLEGELAAAGLLELQPIRKYLRHDRQPDDPTYIRLLELSAVEGWLRSFGR